MGICICTTLGDSSESLSKDIAARKDDEASTKCVKFSSWGSYGCAPHPHHVNVALGLLVLATREPLLRSGFPVRGSVGSSRCAVKDFVGLEYRLRSAVLYRLCRGLGTKN